VWSTTDFSSAWPEGIMRKRGEREGGREGERERERERRTNSKEYNTDRQSKKPLHSIKSGLVK
jgi:hypothetical protein